MASVEFARRASYAVSIVHLSIILLVLAILLMHEIANLASYANLAFFLEIIPSACTIASYANPERDE